MRILTLLVRHGTDKFPGAIDDVAAVFARQLPEVEWDLIVIDNKLAEDYEEVLAPHRLLIGGSNAMREFWPGRAVLRLPASGSPTMTL